MPACGHTRSVLLLPLFADPGRTTVAGVVEIAQASSTMPFTNMVEVLSGAFKVGADPLPQTPTPDPNPDPHSNPNPDPNYNPNPKPRADHTCRYI